MYRTSQIQSVICIWGFKDCPLLRVNFCSAPLHQVKFIAFNVLLSLVGKFMPPERKTLSGDFTVIEKLEWLEEYTEYYKLKY
jgi:hypothetical protein